MRIILTKISDDKHTLAIVREDKTRECMECETKSFLMHDLLHYAIESQADIRNGIWGALAAGKTLADINDRTGQVVKEYIGGLSVVEPIVGAFSTVVKGKVDTTDFIAKLKNLLEAQGKEIPVWLSEEFITTIAEMMHKLKGQWNATPYGQSMELVW